MSTADFLDEYFESEIVKAHFAGSSIIGTALGPRSPGTAYVLLHHYMGEIDDTVGAWGFARGGMGAVSASLAASLRASGETIRTGAGIDRMLCGADAPSVSCCTTGCGDPRAAGALEHGCQADISRIGRGEGTARRVRAASAQLQDPRFVGQAQHRARRVAVFPAIPADSPGSRGDMHVTDTIEMMERAYDDWKRGRVVARALYRHADSVADRSDHGARRQALHVGFVRYCPYELASGPWDTRKRHVRRHRDRHYRASQAIVFCFNFAAFLVFVLVFGSSICFALEGYGLSIVGERPVI